MNTLLNGNMPAVVRFEPTNPDHRAAAAYFIKNSSWPKGYRFICLSPYQTVVSMIKDQLLGYYIEQEDSVLAVA